MPLLSAQAVNSLAATPPRWSSWGQEPARSWMADNLELLATAHVLFPVAIAGMATIAFAASIQLGAWVLLVALLATAVAVILVGGNRRESWAILAIVLTLHCVAGVMAAAVPDGSWDGLTYQQEGVLRIAEGWNPLFEQAVRYGIADPAFNDHYPKLSWIAGAAVLLATGAIEAGKLFNLTLLIAAGAQVMVTLLRFTSVSLATTLVIAGLAALSPIAISQMWTFYVDGALGSALTIMVAGLAGYVAGGRRLSLVLALLASCIAVNLKFTGLAYAVVLVGLAVPVTLFWRGGRAAVQLASAAAIAATVAVLLLGYAPYVRNLMAYGDPFHGAPRADVAGVRPANLNEMNRFARFAMSVMSPSSPTRSPESIHLKFPLSVQRSEARALYSADLEVGGFGPLFGAVLVLAGVAMLALVITRSTRMAGATACVIIGALLASMFVHGETWWARYVPQAWLLPLIVASAALAVPAEGTTRLLAYAMIGLLLLNVFIVAANVAWDELRYVRANRATLLAMSAVHQPVPVYFSVFPSLRQRLREAGVPFRIINRPFDASARRHDLPAPGHQAFWLDEPASIR